MLYPSLSPNDPITGEPRRSATADYAVRYEDIAQDGRVKLEAIPQGVGFSAWRKLLRDTPLPELAKRAHIAAIPSRFFIQTFGGPVSVRNHLEATSRYQLARAEHAGEVTRLLLNFHTDIFGVAERTYDPQPEQRGERIHVGRIFSEQVWTRPFAAAGERRVLRLPGGLGVPELPTEIYPWQAPEQALELPDGARWLEGAESPDPQLLHFGLVHTDSNQHVNSLVYPRVIEEAALRRFAALGHRFDVMGTELELAFARPCFAGRCYRVWLRTFELDRRLGVSARLLADPDTGKAHCFARLLF
ncbi:MAG: hypothetical protein KC766_37620 [Myxococcales bacterium]|nr:hypothetical protein [Myxococcales bacterium]